MERSVRVNTGIVSRGLARLVTSPARYAIVALWIAATVLAVQRLPSLSPEGSGRGSLGALAPKNAPALRVEERSLQLFPFPVLSRIAIVQRDPHGLTLAAQRRLLMRAVGIDQHPGHDPSGIAVAAPIVNVRGVVPASRE